MKKHRVGQRDLSMQLAMQGLHPAPSQVWGAIRLVPLIRDVPLHDLRLGVDRDHGDDPMRSVVVAGTPAKPAIYYHAYIPYALVVSFTTDDSPVCASDTWMGPREHQQNARVTRPAPGLREPMHRMVKRRSDTSYRMLPLHLAMEGFLALHFAGPEIAWDTWSDESLRSGLSPRWENAFPGRSMPDLADALRVFEIHQNQCGVLIFSGDSFASAFVVSHPDDYRALHTTLIQDFYGGLVFWHGYMQRNAPVWSVALDESRVTDLDHLARELERGRAAWGGFSARMATGLFASSEGAGREVIAEAYRSTGPYMLYRFHTALHGWRDTPDSHIGEALIHNDGTLAYLKTYRLDRSQAERGMLLQQLARHEWRLDAAARALGYSSARLKKRLAEVGFERLLRHTVR